jgi:hypothetical protein
MADFDLCVSQVRTAFAKARTVGTPESLLEVDQRIADASQTLRQEWASLSPLYRTVRQEILLGLQDMRDTIKREYIRVETARGDAPDGRDG